MTSIWHGRSGGQSVIGLEFRRPGVESEPRAPADGFVDYYELLKISPEAEDASIRRIYRLLAAR